jgi:periplasmic divalent cation tolerance protein
VADHCAVITTTNNEEAAADLAKGIVGAKLAACVQIVGPIRSIYRWQGNVEDEQEWQCWAKTTTDRLEPLTDYIKANHSYDVPEVIALPVIGGNADYLKWVTDETRS